MNSILDDIRGGLIVSCQALPNEPLHSPFIMGRMALAASMGGAVGIRANTVADIAEIKKQITLPIIGIIKKVYTGSDVYITPTESETEALVACNTDIIAMDATNRLRKDNRSLPDIFLPLRKKYPQQLFMADCSTYEEGLIAADLGFDCVGTTLAGYTPYTAEVNLPDLAMISKLAKTLHIPVIAEGGIHYPKQLRKAMEAGAYCAVAGGAITRPQEITRRFVDVL